MSNKLRDQRGANGEGFVPDAGRLQHFPFVPFGARDKRSFRANSGSLVRYRGNDHSVPTAFDHQEYLAHGFVQNVVIACRAGVITRLARF